RSAAVVVLVMIAALFLARLGARALWAEEGRWAEIAREMILSGNYFWPTINGKLYYDKPLLSYWLVVIASLMNGGVDEFTTRVPCAIAGVLSAGLLMVMARKLYDMRAAVLAGLILATSYSFAFYSRAASADVETVAGEMAALTLFVAYREQPTGWWIVGL